MERKGKNATKAENRNQLLVSICGVKILYSVRDATVSFSWSTLFCARARACVFMWFDTSHL